MLDFVTDRIAIGSAGAARFRADEFDAVLDCAFEVPLVGGRPGLHLPLIDDDPIPERYLDRAIEFLDEHAGAGRRVLVHCMGGMSRSVSVVCAYLALREDAPLEEVLRRIQLRRPLANPAEEVWASVERYVTGRRLNESSGSSGS